MTINRITKIDIDDQGAAPPTAAIEKERKVAIFDLLEGNSFTLEPRGDEIPLLGPYHMNLAIRDKRLVVDIRTQTSEAAAVFYLSLGPFRQVVKDYFSICESYFDASKNRPPAQIEAIDMARRGIHNEGARVLQERLEGKARIDIDTSRRLFTLICVLHWGAR